MKIYIQPIYCLSLGNLKSELFEEVCQGQKKITMIG